MASAPDTYLTTRELASDRQDLEPANLPKANILTRNGRPTVVALAATGDGGFSPRTVILWLTLVIAVGVLVLAVLKLARSIAKR
ncbi:MAG: hypothetical protein KGL48_05090 [Sphingomonadales bacterium]|nr:hypothetical protein [Sphingomonadales bacterium]MDE2568702.1 hypothetical protein [Sphingomonadales bacterium]